jgi:serine/threonine-protein kinase
MGVVLEAEHVHLQERRAIKVLREEPTSEEVVLRFVREARAAMAVDSPQVARVFDMGALPGGRLYIVMEHLQGETLRDVLARQAPLPVDVAVRVLQEVCKGVAAAHAQGIVHRDLKPANIFLVGELEHAAVKVLDFGLAKGVAHPQDVTLTTSASVLGSPMYMAPEQIRDARRVDARADVWALGVILHEALSGKPPFHAATVSGLLASIVADRARALPASVPKHIARVVERCLDKDPERRIASASELEAALGEPKRRRRRIWIPIAAALAIGTALVVAFAQGPEPTPAPEPPAAAPTPVLTTPAPLVTAAAPSATIAPSAPVPAPAIVRRHAPPPAPSASAPPPIDPLLGEATETRR